MCFQHRSFGIEWSGESSNFIVTVLQTPCIVFSPAAAAERMNIQYTSFTFVRYFVWENFVIKRTEKAMFTQPLFGVGTVV